MSKTDKNLEMQKDNNTMCIECGALIQANNRVKEEPQFCFYCNRKKIQKY